MHKVIVCGVVAVSILVGCKKAEEPLPASAVAAAAPAQAQAASPAAVQPPAPAAPEAPFKVVWMREGKEETLSLPFACLDGEVSGTDVMTGWDPKDPCSYDSEDGFSLSLDLAPLKDGKKQVDAPLPKPGAQFGSQIGLAPDPKLPNADYGEASLRVLRYERPYIVVEVSPAAGEKAPEGVKSFGGTLKVKVPEVRQGVW